MKEETKELVDFIKDCVFRYQTELKRGEVDVGIIDGEKEDKTCDKAITFLDSLPEIESHLCIGGYIQDKNGTPCCNGDRITGHGFINNEESVVQGTLRYGFMKGEEKKYVLFPHWWLDLDDNASFLPEEGIEKVVE